MYKLKIYFIILNLSPYIIIASIVLSKIYIDSFPWLEINKDLSKNIFILLVSIPMLNIFYFLKIFSSKILAIFLTIILVALFYMVTFYIFVSYDNYLVAQGI